MFWRTKVHISEQMYASFKPLLYIVRQFGVFPFTMEKNRLGLFMKWSPWYALYGFIMASLIIVTSFSEAVSDMISKEGVIIDVINNIDKIVWLFVTGVYCLGTFMGVFITPCYFPLLCNYIKCINQVDSVIKINSANSNKCTLSVMALTLFMHSIAIYILFTYVYASLVDSAIELFEILLTRVTPMSVHIWIGLMIEYFIRLMANTLSRRFGRLNKILNDHYMKLKKEENVGCIHNLKVIKASKDSTKIDGLLVSTLPTFAENIIKLSQVYIKLMEAAQILNDLFGLTIMIVMASAVFQLVSTPYYVILSLQGKRRGFVEVAMRLLKFSQQLLRVLFLTEPFYECLINMKDTATHVCNLLSLNIGKSYRKQVNAFAMSICLNQLKFSACGFFDIDRFLISTLVGTVTTYVVILLQAQEGDEK